MSERSTREIELAEDPDELHRVNKQSFIDEQEWHLYKVTTKVIHLYMLRTGKKFYILVLCLRNNIPIVETVQHQAELGHAFERVVEFLGCGEFKT